MAMYFFAQSLVKAGFQRLVAQILAPHHSFFSLGQSGSPRRRIAIICSFNLFMHTTCKPMNIAASTLKSSNYSGSHAQNRPGHMS